MPKLTNAKMIELGLAVVVDAHNRPVMYTHKEKGVEWPPEEVFTFDPRHRLRLPPLPRRGTRVPPSRFQTQGRPLPFIHYWYAQAHSLGHQVNVKEMLRSLRRARPNLAEENDNASTDSEDSALLAFAPSLAPDTEYDHNATFPFDDYNPQVPLPFDEYDPKAPLPFDEYDPKAPLPIASNN